MYTTSKHRETRQATIVKTTRFSDQDPFEEWSDPEELESWTMEEMKDLLPSHDILAMDEFEVPWRQTDSFAQMHGLVD